MCRPETKSAVFGNERLKLQRPLATALHRTHLSQKKGHILMKFAKKNRFLRLLKVKFSRSHF